MNNTTSDNYYMGSTIGRFMADAMGAKGKVAVFNGFSGALRICGIRYELWKYVLQDYPGIEIIQPELAEAYSNAPEDARQQTLALLAQYPEGQLDAIHVACWDQPAIGVVQALEEAGRAGDVIVTALDAGPDTLEIMKEEGSPFVANVAQQPGLIGKTAADNVARHFAGENVAAADLHRRAARQRPRGRGQGVRTTGLRRVGAISAQPRQRGSRARRARLGDARTSPRPSPASRRWTPRT